MSGSSSTIRMRSMGGLRSTYHAGDERHVIGWRTAVDVGSQFRENRIAQFGGRSVFPVEEQTTHAGGAEFGARFVHGFGETVAEDQQAVSSLQLHPPGDRGERGEEAHWGAVGFERHQRAVAGDEGSRVASVDVVKLTRRAVV